MSTTMPLEGALAVSGSRPEHGLSVRSLLKFALLLFLLACVFDPADQLLGLKVQLFLLCWCMTALACLTNRAKCVVHVGLVTYTLIFILIPVLSITGYWAVNGAEPFEGYQLLKGYLLITFAIILYVNRINLLPQLCAVLTILAIAIIGVFIALVVEPDLFPVLYAFGAATNIVLVNHRDYGGGLVLLQIYFVTSPMLAIAIAYYFRSMRLADRRGRKLFFGLLVLLNVCGMLLAGTRNNIAIALFLPLVLFFLYSRHKIINAFLGAIIILLLGMVFFEQVQLLLDPAEFSNYTKLAMLNDYREMFGNPADLLLGQGLGAYQYWSAKGEYYFISELTYLELMRNFGVFGGLVVLGLLLFPLAYAGFMNRAFEEKHIIVGYAAYLVMCMSNPNLFSSMGILILSVVLANIFLFDSRYRLTRGVNRLA